MRRRAAAALAGIFMVTSGHTGDAAERQLTRAAHGHVLTNVNAWSPDSRRIVYDVRSVDSVFDGDRIEDVDAETGEVRVLYRARDGAKVVIDETSLELLGGSQIDYVEDMIGASFQIKNPIAKSSCGCGNSFSV